MTSLVVAVTPRTGKINKNGLNIFERGEILLQNGILHFLFKPSQVKPIVRNRVTKFSQKKN